MTDSIHTCLFVVFMFSSFVQLFYTWYFFSRVAFYRGKEKRRALPPVSVIIAARNEFENLKRNLPHILEQDYPVYEVIVVNDASGDQTRDLLDELKKNYAHLRCINLTQRLNFFRGKKFPLSLGIKSADHEILLLTDADCHPRSKGWIRRMVEKYHGDTGVVLGYGAYQQRKGFLDKAVRFETLHVAIQYFSFALAGLPYMGVGRNLSYKRDLFYRSKGFTSHYKIQSGDDDLFIHNVARKNNTAIALEPGSHTISTPPDSFAGFLRQKRRHLSTGKYYSLKFKFLLGLYSTTQFLFWITFIFLMIIQFNIVYLLLTWGIRLASQGVVFRSIMGRLNETNIFLLSPLLEVMFVVINPLLAISAMIFKQDRWK